MKYVEKCRYADKYKVTRKPTCGCFVCETRWRLAQMEKEVSELHQKVSEMNSGRGSADAALYVANLSR